MSVTTGVVVGVLLGTAVVLHPDRGRPPPRPARGPRRSRTPRGAAEDDALAAAKVAERAAALLRAGVPPDLAWEHAGGEGVPAPVRSVWRLVTATGAPAAQALEAGAAGARADAAARAAVRTALAGARVSARTVSLLPLLGLVLGAALGAPPWQTLLGSAPGRLSGALGLALLLAGRWWSARLVRSAERQAGAPARTPVGVRVLTRTAAWWGAR